MEKEVAYRMYMFKPHEVGNIAEIVLYKMQELNKPVDPCTAGLASEMFAERMYSMADRIRRLHNKYGENSRKVTRAVNRMLMEEANFVVEIASLGSNLRRRKVGVKTENSL